MTCRNCNSDGTQVIRDLTMDRAWKSGNPYQRWCVNCGSFKYAASRVEWEASDEKYVKPRDGGDIVLVENDFDCPKCERYNHGYPDECGNCGVSFDWDDQN